MQIAARGKLLPLNWQSLLPDNSAPYTSTIVFLVRKGNPKGIKDWGDLIKPGIGVITPNPKTSGGARWNYLAAWAWARHQPGGSDARPRSSCASSTANVPVLDTGARDATTTFVQRGIGDVLLAWENEAFLAQKELGSRSGPDRRALVEHPRGAARWRWWTRSPQARHHCGGAAEYLQHLYSKEAQEIIARNFYRPRDPEVAKKYAAQFPQLQLATIADFGGWERAQGTHFKRRRRIRSDLRHALGAPRKPPRPACSRAGRGLQDLRQRRILLDLLPQAVHQLLEQLAVPGIAVSPDMHQQAVRAHGAPGVHQQHLQQPQLQLGETHGRLARRSAPYGPRR
jgi:sulfate/thiosulfate-binding protein